MSKKGCFNAFYYFMLDYQQQEEKRTGKKYFGLKEVQADPKCSIAWKSLSKEDKQVYEDMAKKAKNKKFGKLTGTGESVNELQEQEKKWKEFLVNMDHYIATLVNSSYRDNVLATRQFYLIHVNYFYKQDMGINKSKYAPAEVAIVNFSLKKGIEDVYHTLFYCKPKLGYTRVALEYSSQTHKITCQLESGETDLHEVASKIATFMNLSDGGKDMNCYIYTMNREREVVESFFNQITTTEDKLLGTVYIYSLETLFSKLRNVSLTEKLPHSVSEIDLVNDIFSYASNIECGYHKRIIDASIYCSMSIVKRWVFTICDHCCENLKIVMKPGVHFPLPPSKDEKTLLTLQPSFNSSSLSNAADKSLVSSIKHLTLSEASEYHRQAVSMRTAKDEELRKTQGKPLKIIDYSVRSQTSELTDAEQDKQSEVKTTTDTASVSEVNCIKKDGIKFPFSLGRGIPMFRMKESDFPSLGNGKANLDE